jgi:hypothetical protein|tara:strand:+ start:1608 stop:1775 length:168 start_codon:yes stop_codon:yes gene_type:complete
MYDSKTDTVDFKNVTTGALVGAVVRMCEELKIAGSTAEYDLYKAIQDEHAKVTKK